MVSAIRVALIVATLSSMVACAGKRGDSYVEAVDVQRECCEHLAGTRRDRCLRDIPRVNDPDVAMSATNQATFGCVLEHFVCNRATGRPTKESAQAQYDCVESLPQPARTATP